MYKVELLFKKNTNVKEDNGIINDLYNNYSAKMISKGADDGVYYVSNFPKDLVHKVSKDDTIESLASRGIVAQKDEIFENNVIISKNLVDKIYTVRPLDTLERVCRICGLTVSELIQMNNLKSTKLFVGQRLFINSL